MYALQRELDVADVESGEYETAERMCDNLLKSNPDDEDVLRVKLYCMLQQYKWTEALSLASRIESDFEKAYCLYRLNRFEDALKSLKEEKDKDDERYLHLEAQILYRLEKHEDASNAYDEIVSKGLAEDKIDAEICTNAIAASSMANRDKNSLKKLLEVSSKVSEKRHELLYNVGTASIFKGDRSSALKYLLKAREACADAYDEEDEKEEMEDERSIVDVQLAYLEQLKGNEVVALKAYEEILKRRPTDKTVAAVASNNIVAIHGDSDLFDSYRKAKVALNAESKLTSDQREIMTFNFCLLLIKMGRLKEARDLIRKLQDKERVSILNVALLVRHGKIEEARELVKNSTSVQLQLVDAQLSLMEKDYDSAVQTLSSSESIAFLPGVVGTIVSILSSRGEKKSDEEKQQKCDETIDRALKYWKTQRGDEKKSLIEILDASASQALELECWSDAANVLESLVQEQKNDPRCSRWLTQLMTAYSYFDISKAESLAQSLPLEQSFESSINAETLERLPVQKINQQVLRGGDNNDEDNNDDEEKTTTREEKKKEKYRDDDGVRKRRKAKILKRRAKLRELYLKKLREKLGLGEEEKLPSVDPDRWKPKQQRASFKKSRGGSRRGRDKKYASGAQGAGDASKKDSLKFDAAARVARGEVLQNEKSTANKSVVSGGKKRRKRRKKKKGRR
eukprot:g1558.t1